jgi:ADP-ribose pyrophosphatase YjhB (NUDIX family)
VSPADAPVVAVGGVAVVDGRLLMVRRGHGPAAGTWSVPGGRVELGETLHEAVVREVAEETGVRAVVVRFLGWAEQIEPSADGDPWHFVLLDFEVAPLEPEVVPVAGDDATEALWVPLDELDDYRLAPGLRDFLVDAGVLDA